MTRVLLVCIVFCFIISNTITHSIIPSRGRVIFFGGPSVIVVDIPSVRIDVHKSVRCEAGFRLPFLVYLLLDFCVRIQDIVVDVPSAALPITSFGDLLCKLGVV